MKKKWSPLLHLGAAQSGKHIFLDADWRKTHMHVIGASGRGKSFFLEYLIRQDIRNGDGVCLLDPHGELYHHIVRWCAEHPSIISWDKLVLLDASDPGWTFGFNPLKSTNAEPSYAVDSMVNACAQVWGGEDPSSMPLLKRVLRNVFHVLAEKNLTLLEAMYLINETDELRPLRCKLTEDLQDPVIRDQWDKWNELKGRELREAFGSTTNRLMEFIAAQIIRAIIGQQVATIDFRSVMDKGAVVLVNLEPRSRLSDFNARTLGTLIANDLFLNARNRPEESRPFYFYIDECGYFLNESIKRILDETRKHGLHLTLSHQHLSQLREAGNTVYSAVMTDAQTKVIFGGLFDEDREALVKEVFLDLDLEEPKHSLSRRVAVGQEAIILRSGSAGTSKTTGRSHTDAETSSFSTGMSSGESESESQVIFSDGTEAETKTGAWGVQDGTSETESYGSASAVTESESDTITEMTGWTESFRTIYADAIGGVYTLEEQRYKKSAWLKKQPPQMALLVQPDLALCPFRVAPVRTPKVSQRRYDRFVQQRYEALPFVCRDTESLMQIEQRAIKLKQAAGLLPSVIEEGEIDHFDNG